MLSPSRVLCPNSLPHRQELYIIDPIEFMDEKCEAILSILSFMAEIFCGHCGNYCALSCAGWMAEKVCVERLQKEYRALYKEPVSNVVARPNPKNILECHYLLEGSDGTPFAGGYYYGKITFPPEYPNKPPGIRMTTPNGRFSTQKKICLSMSDFHPESWNPMWSVSSILTGLLSFMMETGPTTGSVTTTAEEKQRLARSSLAFNCKNPTFRKLFPEYVEKYEQQLAAQEGNFEPSLKKRGTKEEPKNIEVPNEARMNVSAPEYETKACSSFEFDYEAGFTQFLQEARKSVNQERLNATNLGAAPTQKLHGEKRNKKSWKNSIFLWFKIDKKDKSTNRPMGGTTISKPGHGWVHVSGPIQASVGNITGSRIRRSASGPLTSLFSSTSRAEDCYQVPYICLDQLKNRQGVHSYGPVYLVT
ncbi:hypothetical protein F511_09908 [Dorcoceras hygrometricum]|uniref:UBC core domain-containing protein n=1 Tax=Dorcoceras hygrometricum TaxID=472368 RepID=A0A2Z7C980_9LAMI|nr:hypothetical protein F511_09908 [Dorcoceras hygrometricum]